MELTMPLVETFIVIWCIWVMQYALETVIIYVSYWVLITHYKV